MPLTTSHLEHGAFEEGPHSVEVSLLLGSKGLVQRFLQALVDANQACVEKLRPPGREEDHLETGEPLRGKVVQSLQLLRVVVLVLKCCLMVVKISACQVPPEYDLLYFALPGVLLDAFLDCSAHFPVRLREVQDVRVREAKCVELSPVIVDARGVLSDQV